MISSRFLRLRPLRRAVLASLTLLAAIGVEAAAPDVPDQLDLATAIRFALDNNYAIRLARERLREQEGLIVEVRAQTLPDVSLNSAYSLSDEELSSDR
ncbi:MAG TPA: TolC family protein [Candidatus Synoicihabitans sp.]|nr:TolC family protein [Candidatus Synoicihabitans sp.]